MTYVIKQFCLQTSEKVCIKPEVHETLPQVFTWPSSLLLSLYIATHIQDFRDKVILEIGAGTGLVSAVAAMIGAKSVIATDRDDEIIQSNLIKTIELNNLSNIITPREMNWFQSSILEKEAFFFDVILGADVFYSGEDFDPILYQVSLVFSKNPGSIFITAYQERSSSRNIMPILHKYNMKAKYIACKNFLHLNHTFQANLLQFYSEPRFENFDNIHLIQVEQG